MSDTDDAGHNDGNPWFDAADDEIEYDEGPTAHCPTPAAERPWERDPALQPVPEGD